MRILTTLAVVATLWAAGTAGDAQAATRWCAFDGDAVQRCGFRSLDQCRRSAGAGIACRRETAGHARPRAAAAPGQVYPSAPYWAAPGECYLDDGYGRFRRCNSGGDGGGMR